jgi:type IV secretory pathway VirB10-like protein
MADLEPGTAPVIDKRPIPRGVLPKGMLTWVMGGVATIIVLITLFAGSPKPIARPARAVTPAPQAPNADRLNEYQRQVRSIDERARAQAAEPPQPLPRDLSQMPGAAGVPAAQAPAPDPLAEERKRREYDSLFASNVVASRRTGTSQLMGSSQETTVRRASGGGNGQGGPDHLPTLEETAAAVIRASGQAGQTMAGMSVPAAAAPTTSAAQASPITPSAVTRTPAIESAGPLHRLLEGTLIDAVLTNRLDGSSASPVNALVTNPIYSHRGDHVLIPAGARVLGESKPVQNVGEARLAVGFHRLLFPDGSTVSLDQFKALNQVGDNALHDRVNNHYLSTFGAAAAVGLVTGLGQYVGSAGVSGGDGDRTVVVTGNVGSATTQAIAQVMNRFLNRLPTITIREGTRLKVYLTNDLELPAYASPSIAQKGHP